MPEIEAALATVDFTEEQIEKLRRAFHPAKFTHIQGDDAEALDAALAEVDVAIIKRDLDRRFLRASRLRWVHCDKARPG